MNMNFLKDIFGNDKVNIINNPFSKSAIENISINMRKNIFTGEPKFYGIIEFKNGNTSGEQRIEGKDLADVFIKVREFCSNLK